MKHSKGWNRTCGVSSAVLIFSQNVWIKFCIISDILGCNIVLLYKFWCIPDRSDRFSRGFLFCNKPSLARVLFIFVTVFPTLLVTGFDFGALSVQIHSVLILLLSVLSKFKLSRDVTFLTGWVATGVWKQFRVFSFRVKESRKISVKTLRFP
jgi:hypothetical protein